MARGDGSCPEKRGLAEVRFHRTYGSADPGPQTSPPTMHVLPLCAQLTWVATSKRSCSGLRWEPRCSVVGPRVCRSAQLSRWVAVCLTMHPIRQAWNTFVTQGPGCGREWAGRGSSWGREGSYLIHIQLYLVPHLQALGGYSLMQDEAPTGLRPGHRE